MHVRKKTRDKFLDEKIEELAWFAFRLKGLQEKNDFCNMEYLKDLLRVINERTGILIALKVNNQMRGIDGLEAELAKFSKQVDRRAKMINDDKQGRNKIILALSREDCEFFSHCLEKMREQEEMYD